MEQHERSPSADQDKVKAARERLRANFETSLNSHGHAFQYSIVKRAKEFEVQGAPWSFLGTEIPVEQGGDVTHIDIVLWCPTPDSDLDRQVHLIIETKRVDPARGAWCFAKSPYKWSNEKPSDVYTQFETVTTDDSSRSSRAFTQIVRTSATYELGIEVKTGLQGDGTGGHDRSLIDKAVAQVLKATSGYINFLTKSAAAGLPIIRGTTTAFLPAVFTTAELFTTTANLSQADLRNGFLEKGSVDVQKTDWLWFNHNRSHHLRHDVEFDYSFNRGYSLYLLEFTRSIAIVGCDGIDSFLNASFPDHLTKLLYGK